MEEAFRKVVQQIFHNWTALNLVLEHSESQRQTTEVVNEFINYMVQYCLNTSNIHETDIEEALDDVMDQEFETVCEDNSTNEIAKVLYKFLTLIKQGNTEEFDKEFGLLPVTTVASNSSKPVSSNIVTDDTSSEESMDTTDQVAESDDPGWTQVRTRRKR